MIELSYLLFGSGFVVAALLMLYLAKAAFDFATPFKLSLQLTEKDNPAMGILLAGYLFGVLAVLCGTFIGEGEGSMNLDGFLTDMGPTALYGVIGMGLLLLAGIINDKFILREFSNTDEIVKKQNKSVSVVMASGFLGSGLIIAGGLLGSEDILSMLLAFGLGQLALVLFAVIYQKATSYDDQIELGERQNLACGVAFAGNIIAYSLLLMKALTMGSDDIQSLTDRLSYFAYYAISGAVLLPILRFINDIAFLPNAKLTDEIANDQNLNAGLMEACLGISMAIVLIITL